jgi:hypothetical protein
MKICVLERTSDKMVSYNKKTIFLLFVIADTEHYYS